MQDPDRLEIAENHLLNLLRDLKQERLVVVETMLSCHRDHTGIEIASGGTSQVVDLEHTSSKTCAIT